MIVKLEDKLLEEPLASANDALGITIAWATQLSFVAQVSLALLPFELGQY